MEAMLRNYLHSDIRFVLIEVILEFGHAIEHEGVLANAPPI